MKNKNWSQKVTKGSDALDLEKGVFTWTDPLQIAKSLKHSTLISSRRKASPFQSAMNMLTFYINRAGKKLDPQQRQILEEAKEKLRILFNK